jgi:beta-barrel assembly-enhancing protease
MRKAWLAGCLSLLLGTGCTAVTPEALGRMAARGAMAALPIGPEKEVEIGRGIAATVAGRYRLLDDEALTRYVNLVGLAVAQQSPRAGEITFRFGVLDSDEVNAFAAPGGYILVTRGALAVLSSESELAGVLAHEIAHVDEKHILDGIRNADMLRGVTEEAQLGGAVLDRINEFGSSLLFTGLERGDELESDSLAILYAVATGYRPDGLLRFLLAIEEEQGAEPGRLRELRASHPPAGDRIEAIRRQLAALGPAAGEGAVLEERYRQNVSVAAGRGR